MIEEGRDRERASASASDPGSTSDRRAFEQVVAEDRALADAIAAGDREAFRRLVERETTSVFRTCYRVLGHIDDAEDATQETFMIAYRAIASFRGEGPLAAWLARIAVRHALQRATSPRRRRDVVDLSEVLHLPGRELDPLSSVLSDERGHEVRALVVGLDEPYREVVTLRFFGERSLAEIASITGRPLGTVKAQLHRGLSRLRQRLEGAAT